MFVINASRTGESLAITRRRQTEQQYSNFEAVRMDDQMAAQRAYWEKNTQKQIERNDIANIARGIESDAQQKLQARRQRLAALYAKDEAQHKQDIANTRETSEAKARRMVAHARKLKAQREEKRKQFAQEMYNRQWRASCDDLRHIGSERFREHCYGEIAVQRVEKVRQKQASEREEAMWANTWEQGRVARVHKEEQQKKQRQQFNHETKMALFDQMEHARSQKLKEAYDEELERENFRKQMAEDEAFARQCQYENSMEQKRRMDEILAFNNATQAAKQSVESKQKQQELNDLNQKIELHKADLEEQRRRKQQMRVEMQDYMAYLRQQKAELKMMEEHIERLCLEDQDRENAKRDAVRQRAEASRERLKEDVLEGRALQLADLQERHRQLEADLEVERQAVLEEARRAQAEEYLEEEDYRRQEIAHQQDILRQMHENRIQKNVQEALVIEDRETAIANERAYRAFVQREKQLAERQGVQIKQNFFS